MSYGSVRKQLTEQHQPEKESTACAAIGCPCRGAISLEGGKWTCGAHAFSPADRWPGITEKLRDHDWLVNFTDQVKTMDQQCKDWRGFSNQFWDGQDDFCKPHEQEDALMYELRLRGELLYRVGLKKRPAPRIPEPVKSRGNAGALLGRRAA